MRDELEGMRCVFFDCGCSSDSLYVCEVVVLRIYALGTTV